MLHEEVRRARRELNLTQEELAKRAGVQRRQLSSLENGKNVTLKTVRKIIEVLPNLQSFTLAAAEVEVEPAAPSAHYWEEVTKTFKMMVEMLERKSELTTAYQNAIAAGNTEEAARLQAEFESLPSMELRRRMALY